jgi:hypothetical protein
MAAEPCIICGGEGPRKAILCEYCQEKVDKRETNYVPCHKHGLLHWRFDECPMCGIIERKRQLIGGRIVGSDK